MGEAEGEEEEVVLQEWQERGQAREEGGEVVEEVEPWVGAERLKDKEMKSQHELFKHSINPNCVCLYHVHRSPQRKWADQG